MIYYFEYNFKINKYTNIKFVNNFDSTMSQIANNSKDFNDDAINFYNNNKYYWTRNYETGIYKIIVDINSEIKFEEREGRVDLKQDFFNCYVNAILKFKYKKFRKLKLNKIIKYEN